MAVLTCPLLVLLDSEWHKTLNTGGPVLLLEAPEGEAGEGWNSPPALSERRDLGEGSLSGS